MAEQPTVQRDGHRPHLEFPPEQSHNKAFELAMLAICIACVIIVLVILLATNVGNEFRPTV